MDAFKNELEIAKPSEGPSIPTQALLREQSTANGDFEILKCAAADAALEHFDLRVLICVGRHLNESGVARLTDDTIAEETFSSRRSVLRARKRLKDAGWLGWRVASGLNLYSLTGQGARESSADAPLHMGPEIEILLRGSKNLAHVPPMAQALDATPSLHSPTPAVSQGGVTASLSSVSQNAMPDTDPTAVTEAAEQGSMPDIPPFLDRRAARVVDRQSDGARGSIPSPPTNTFSAIKATPVFPDTS